MKAGLEIRKAISSTDLFRQGILDVVAKLIQSSGNDPPKLTAGDARDLFVNGNDASDIERGRLVTFINGLKFRVVERKRRFVVVEIDAARAPGFGPETSCSAGGIRRETTSREQTGSVRQNDVEDASSCVSESRGCDLRLNRGVCPTLASQTQKSRDLIGSVPR
jgi:hypothetical protein